jgi:hypothetical protein
MACLLHGALSRGHQRGSAVCGKIRLDLLVTAKTEAGVWSNNS